MGCYGRAMGLTAHTVVLGQEHVQVIFLISANPLWHLKCLKKTHTLLHLFATDSKRITSDLALTQACHTAKDVRNWLL